jgi:hypothetical protein
MSIENINLPSNIEAALEIKQIIERYGGTAPDFDTLMIWGGIASIGHRPGYIKKTRMIAILPKDQSKTHIR